MYESEVRNKRMTEQLVSVGLIDVLLDHIKQDWPASTPSVFQACDGLSKLSKYVHSYRT